jgi:hypothetical protein
MLPATFTIGDQVINAEIEVEFNLGWCKEHPELFEKHLNDLFETYKDRRFYAEARGGFILIRTYPEQAA